MVPTLDYFERSARAGAREGHGSTVRVALTAHRDPPRRKVTLHYKGKNGLTAAHRKNMYNVLAWRTQTHSGVYGFYDIVCVVSLCPGLSPHSPCGFTVWIKTTSWRPCIYNDIVTPLTPNVCTIFPPKELVEAKDDFTKVDELWHRCEAPVPRFSSRAWQCHCNRARGQDPSALRLSFAREEALVRAQRGAGEGGRPSLVGRRGSNATCPAQPGLTLGGGGGGRRRHEPGDGSRRHDYQGHHLARGCGRPDSNGPDQTHVAHPRCRPPACVAATVATSASTGTSRHQILCRMPIVIVRRGAVAVACAGIVEEAESMTPETGTVDLRHLHLVNTMNLGYAIVRHVALSPPPPPPQPQPQRSI